MNGGESIAKAEFFAGCGAFFRRGGVKRIKVDAIADNGDSFGMRMHIHDAVLPAFRHGDNVRGIGIRPALDLFSHFDDQAFAFQHAGSNRRFRPQIAHVQHNGRVQSAFEPAARQRDEQRV